MNETNRSRELVRYELVAESEEMGSAETTIASVHRHLRGRYHLAAVAAIVCAGAFAVAGWHATRPQYESSALVRIDPVPATTMHDPDGMPMPSLMSAYVAEQSTILGGRLVLEAASRDPILRAAGWPAGNDGLAALEGSVEVEQLRGQNILSLRLVDNEPARAQAAVNAVLRAYQPLAAGPAERERALRLDSLGRRQAELLARIDELELALLEASRGTSPELIERMHINKVEELIAIDAQLEDLRMRRSAIETGERPEDLGGPTASATTPQGRANATLLATLTTHQNEILARIDALSIRYGNRHPMMRDLDAELETVRIRIAALTDAPFSPGGPGTTDLPGVVADGIDVGFPVAPDPTTEGSTDGTGTSPSIGALATADLAPAERITALIDRIAERRRTLQGEISDLSRRRVSINTMRDRVDEAQARLSDLDRRIEIIRASAEADATGVTIASWGDLPIQPSRDRRSQLAMAGAFGGAAFGVLVVLGVGTLAPRIRYADDLSFVGGAPPIAAILPVMSPHDAASGLRSSRGIHQLRSIVELDTVQPDRNVVVVTGCARGEGRTSTALALATGLARSGRRTLVIDADLSGSKLSRELVLDGEAGLAEALGINPSDARIHQTAEPGLWALPVGVRGVIGEEVLSRPRLQWLLDTLRSRFDAIVVDTGPMLASAEGPTLAGVADRTVLVVERGIRASAVAAALERLRQVSGRCVGIVLNRATESDFRDLEIRSDATATRRGALVETRPSTFAPAGHSAAIAAVRGRPVHGAVDHDAATTTPGRTAA